MLRRMELLHTAHVPAGKGPFPTMIALHGWGASAHDLLGLAPLFSAQNWLFLCPQGTTTLQVGPGMEGYGWFPLERGRPPEPRAFLAASRQLRDFVDRACERYPVDPGRLVVLGFSQGGLMAFDLVLRQPQRFAGLIGLSTWLPELLAANLPRDEAQKRLPVLQVHGTEDQQIEIARARETRDVLEGFGVDLTYREFPMGHEVRPEVLREMARWLSEKALSRG